MICSISVTIRRLTEMPHLKHLLRLRHIGLSNNAIETLGRSIGDYLPRSVISIDLSWNRLLSIGATISALLPFESSLRLLCLLGNPMVLVGSKYRLCLLNAFPHLLYLDDLRLGAHSGMFNSASLTLMENINAVEDMLRVNDDDDDVVISMGFNVIVTEHPQDTSSYQPPVQSNKKGKDAEPM